MNKVILGITGLMASGKGTIGEYLKEKYGAETFRYSTMLRDLLDRLYLPQTRENMQDISTILRARFGEDLMARVMVRDIERSQAPIVVVEGIRRMADIAELRKLPNFKLVAVEADEEVRFQRYKERQENPGDKEMTRARWNERANAETEVLIPSVIENADARINNNGTREDLHKQIDALI